MAMTVPGLRCAQTRPPSPSISQGYDQARHNVTSGDDSDRKDHAASELAVHRRCGSAGCGGFGHENRRGWATTCLSNWAWSNRHARASPKGATLERVPTAPMRLHQTILLYAGTIGANGEAPKG